MRDDPDVLVVGGGVVGLFCAYHLRREGRGVAVVERGAIGGPQSCSTGNTGFVGTHGAAPLAEPAVLAGWPRLLNPDNPLHITPNPDPDLLAWLGHFRRVCTEEHARAAYRVLLRMKKRSLDLLREVCADHGRLAPLLTERGMLLTFKTRDAFEQACRGVPAAVAGGVPLRVLEPGELAELEPGAGFDVYGALLNEEGAFLRISDFMREFPAVLASMGVELREHTEVRGLHADGRRITRVTTTRGDLRPAETVIAAGAWSARHLRGLGVELELQPIKGYTITVKAPANAPRRPVLMAEARVGLTPFGDRLRFGGTLDLTGFDTAIPPHRLDGIHRAVASYLPGLAAEGPPEIEQIWSGLRPCTPDSLPYLGRAGSYDNLSIACGHGHIGLGLAPVTGRLIAQLLSGHRPEMDLTPLRSDRYGRRRPPPP